ncbi:molybdate ABC transporter permease subunit [Falsibacillus albus]|uniref:Molybdenum transport system permease n=1 Tax=Falsibacillus albus TaxID=2478915 RepID=A0A3L7K2X5_9BACI|nr:molybdate ABC transporter permease subunit [Falsibacillus albus]RLQ97348.1 molybdate ABC transporter permease subunit [Falsibacillus albus]
MNADFWNPILLSVKISIISTMIVLCVGLFFSKMLLRKGPTRKGKVIELILLIPLVLPPSVTGLILITWLGNNSAPGKVIAYIFGQGIMFTWWAGVLAAAVVTFPLMYQALKLGLSSIDGEIKGAALVDGAGPWNLFWLIELPLMAKSILTGVVLSFARGLGEFGATLMFAGNIPGETQTASTAIYTAIEVGDVQKAWIWAGALTILSFILLYIIQWMQRE